MEIKVKAYAKINLLLDIVSTRTDGYHDLFMIMQSIGIYDTVTVTQTKSKKITLTCNIDSIPLDEKNIAHKAATAFFKTTKIKNKGINIDIVKEIPHAAGMAGGSADGAAVLVALNKLTQAGLSDDELCKIGVTIGADVPFCIKGGTLLAQGVGDVLNKVKSLPKCYILIAKPDYSVNTAYAYHQFDECGKTHTPDKFAMLCAMQSRDLNQICPKMENVFEQFIEVPGKVEMKHIMRSNNALGVCMSGSGPTVFGIFDNNHDAQNAASQLESLAKDIVITTPVSKGCKIMNEPKSDKETVAKASYDNKKFIDEFRKILKSASPEKILFVSSKEYDRYGYHKAIDELNIPVVAFNDFQPCPEVSSVKKGTKILLKENCDFIVAVGGGSAIDVAKAIKLFSEKPLKILAVPTTAGTGAEVTRFAVLYNKGDKDSVGSYDIIPDYAVFDYSSLSSLPYIQRVVTGLDAFSHSVEAYWSVDATDESREYSVKALEIFSLWYEKYLNDDKNSYEPMMKCSELAGRAINIARTTAPHAMSYKLHKLKGFYHGQAVAVCLAWIWQYMLENCDTAELQILLAETQLITGFEVEEFQNLLKKLGLCDNLTMTKAEFDECVNGVNIQRMSNSPMKFTKSDIEKIYSSFIKIK